MLVYLFFNFNFFGVCLFLITPPLSYDCERYFKISSKVFVPSANLVSFMFHQFVINETFQYEKF